jgi:hypothetical protein
MAKLYIYDSSSSIDRKQAAGRFSGQTGVHTLAASSVADLTSKLDALLAAGRTFDRVLFQTHGNSGTIFFNGDAIGKMKMVSFAKYSRLFPKRTKVYFDGCNVAEGRQGWEFLEATGKALLASAGGVSMGYTSMGAGLPGWLPFIGGHTEHLLGDLRLIDFKTGGVEVQRLDSDDGMVTVVKIAAILKQF